MKYFIYTIIGVVAVAIIAGFFIVGFPQEERLRRFDDQKISSLQTIQNYIVEFYRAKNKLPENLAVMNDDLRGVIVPKDPQTGREYEYRTTGELSFSLCTDFNRPSFANYGENMPKASSYAYPYRGPFGDETWTHSEGKVCFARTIDKDFFFPLKEKPL